MTHNEFIEYVGALASKDMEKSKILASLTIAQAILESAYGTSELAVHAKALFGIKVNGWTGRVYEKKTGEYYNGKYVTVVAKFRAYDSWEQSISDHSNYLLTREKSAGVLRYENLIGETNYKRACENIQKDGYATSPTYAKKLISLIETYNLTRFDKGGKPMTKKVFIGVGHGGSDPGAVKYLVEKDVNLTMALACKAVLEANGVQVKMSRTRDENDPIAQEIAECNAFNPDLAVDVHNNAGGGDGFEALVTVHGGTGRVLAKNIEAEVLKLGQNSRGLKTRVNSSGSDYYGFIRSIRCPSIILEGVFVDNANDAKIADTKAEQEAFGRAYARGILKTLGISETVKPPKPTEPTKPDKPKDNMYRVRKSWQDEKSQIGAYKSLTNAKNAVKENPSYNVYDSSGKCVYAGKKALYLAEVSILDLRIRTGAGTNYSIVRYCPKGIYTITQVKKGQGSKAGWGKLKSGEGWISLDFVKRV